MTSLTPEPAIEQYQNPEQALQQSLMAEASSLLYQSRVAYLMLEGFGLDIGLFIQQEEKSYPRFIAVKSYVGSRIGGVSIGDSQGEGSQIDLLIRPSAELVLVDHSIRWVLGMGTLPKGTARYAFFTCNQAQIAVMGQIEGEKQYYLRVSSLRNYLLTWDALSAALKVFLLNR